jgi:predicted RNA binding protein YcfA (HicA-like mRNA interferase family)
MRSLWREIAARSLRRGICEAAAPDGYQEIRQSGSHIRVRSSFRGSEHQVTIPAHSPLKVGTLSGILLEIAGYLEISKEVLARELFG